MRTFHQVAASQLGIGAWYQKGFEKNGILFIQPDGWGKVDDLLGAQCANCHTIIWTRGRKDPILNEKQPDSIPFSGLKYREYYQNKIKRFLCSLPPCPNCHQQNYDLFINNTVVPRYQNGEYSISEADQEPNEELSAKIKDIPVWWYGDSEDTQELHLQLLE